MNDIETANPSTRLAVLVAIAAYALAAGGEASGAAPILYYQVRLEANAPSLEECHEAVAIRFEPVKVRAQPPGSLYETKTYTDQPMIIGKPVLDGPDNWECWFTYRSRNLAPGTWRIVGEFASGPQSCLRDVGPGHPNKVRIDQQEGCVEYDRAGTEVDARKSAAR